MDQVRIRAAVSAHGLTKGREVTVAETPVIAGAIGNVFELLERIPAEPEKADEPENTEVANDAEPVTNPVTDPPEATPPAVEDVNLPDPASTDDGETPATEYQPPGKKSRD